MPLTRLDNADPALMEELLAAVRDIAERGAFILGETVEAFERDFAAVCDTDFAVGVSSGTEALVLSLRALGIGTGDEVLVPTNSFAATAEAVVLAGATPRFLDVDADTQLIGVEQVEEAIGPRVRAVIPVHLYGRTVDMDPILRLARVHDLRVIEDAAQAHGARYKGRRVGSLGDCGCFSFYPAKNLGAWGDAGAVTTSDRSLAERLRLLRAHGENPRYCHQQIGTTARLDAIHAAILRIKLRRLDADNERRRRLARELTRGLAGHVAVPAAAGPGRDHVYHQYVVRSEDRDGLRDHLQRCGVASAIHYPTPIHRSPAFAGLRAPKLPVAEYLADRICSLPIYPTMSERELATVLDACQRFDERRSHHAA